MHLDELRPGQRTALNTILDRLRSKEPKTAIVLPTRYGKSDVIRLAAIMARNERVASASIALSPSEMLRNQLVRGDKIDEMARRYDLPSEARKMRAMLSATEWRPFSNGEYLLSATMQLATLNITLFKQLVEHQSHATGLPVVIHIDETHEVSEDKRRGDLVAALEAAGACIVLYTATPVRADGEMIPGFRANVLSSESIERYVTTDKGDGLTNIVDVYHGVKSLVELVADHRTTFQQAWNEQPSPLCNLSREVIDVRLNDLTSHEGEHLLSQCSVSKARDYLSKAVRHPDVVERAVGMFVTELLRRKQANSEAAGLIFTSSDINRVRNQHAKEIERAIAGIAPDLDVRIVTMKSDEGDEKSSKQLEQFVGANGRRGKGDVLIVKQMGGAGLDAERVKVLLDLSPVRTVSSVIQRIMRVATPWAGMKVGSIITLADPLMDAIWRKYVVEEGGEATPTTVVGELEFVRQYEKPKPPDDLELFEVVSTEFHSFDDNHGQSGAPESIDQVNVFIDHFPALATLYTKAELSTKVAALAAAGVTLVAPSLLPPKSLTEVLANKRFDINDRVKKLAQIDVPYIPGTENGHVKALKSWMKDAKKSAGVDPDVELRDITDSSALDRMLNWLAR